MMGTVVVGGVPNQPGSVSRSASAAVSAGSPVVAAQASLGVRADQEGVGWPVIGFGGADVGAMLPVSAGLAKARAVGGAEEAGGSPPWGRAEVLPAGRCPRSLPPAG
jgi:hypothetical protein